MSKHLNSSDKSDIVKCYIDSPKTLIVLKRYQQWLNTSTSLVLP